MTNLNKKCDICPTQNIILTVYSDTNDSYLCWDESDKHYYFGQKDDENILCWSSLEAFNSFYAVAIKNFSIMKIPNLCPRCAVLFFVRDVRSLVNLNELFIT